MVEMRKGREERGEWEGDQVKLEMVGWDVV